MEQAKTSQPKFLPRMENSASASTNTYVATAGGNPFESEDEEIFSKRKMTLNIPSNCPGSLTNLIVSKNWLFCLLSAEGRLTLLRFFLPRAIPPGRERIFCFCFFICTLITYVMGLLQRLDWINI